MEIILKNLQKKTPIPRAKILKKAKAAFRKLGEGRDRHGFLSVVFVGARRMRALNKRYLGHDYATDVLTFDLGAGQGEIVICPQIASANAKAHQTSTEHEIILYVVHGILHMAGYDDKSPAGILEMRSKEKELL